MNITIELTHEDGDKILVNWTNVSAAVPWTETGHTKIFFNYYTARPLPYDDVFVCESIADIKKLLRKDI